MGNNNESIATDLLDDENENTQKACIWLFTRPTSGYGAQSTIEIIPKQPFNADGKQGKAPVQTPKPKKISQTVQTDDSWGRQTALEDKRQPVDHDEVIPLDDDEFGKFS